MKYLFVLLSFSFLIRAADKDPTLQQEPDWIDARWSKTDVGPFLGGTFETPRRRTNKGIAVKLGAKNEASICFDTDTLRYSAGWTGGFVEMNAGRYGLMAPLKPKGTIVFASSPGPGVSTSEDFKDPRRSRNGPLPKNIAHYKGLNLSGDRVVFSYTVGECSVLDTPSFENGGFARTVELSPAPHDVVLHILDGTNTSVQVALSGSAARLRQSNGIVRAYFPASKEVRVAKISISPNAQTKLISPRELIKPGAARWGEPLETEIHLGHENKALALDSIGVPFNNPWNALMFTSGHDFLSADRAAVCTAHGDVWLVSGFSGQSRKAKWKRFATGLYQPLGLKVVNGKIHVLERDQITILHDTNGDDEADFYENFNNDCISAGGGHSYATSLETDPAGNFYFVKCAENTPHGGSVIKVSKDGRKLEVIATGFRNPNGMGVGPNSEITVADQQGDWVPETRLDLIKPGGFYGYMPMHKRAVAPKNYDAPWCWIPRKIDNSAGGQVWLPKNSWGPLGGNMLHLSYGRCSLLGVLPDQSHPRKNAGTFTLLTGFLSGAMRGRVNPYDGHLYVTGLRGWQTAALRDGCFQRVRYTNKPFHAPIAFKSAPSSITISFDVPLESEAAHDLDSYAMERWNYKWSSAYGSADYSVEKPGEKGRDKLEIKKAKLSADKKSITLEIGDLRPAMQMLLKYQLLAEDGIDMPGEFAFTLNTL